MHCRTPNGIIIYLLQGAKVATKKKKSFQLSIQDLLPHLLPAKATSILTIFSCSKSKQCHFQWECCPLAHRWEVLKSGVSLPQRLGSSQHTWYRAEQIGVSRSFQKIRLCAWQHKAPLLCHLPGPHLACLTPNAFSAVASMCCLEPVFQALSDKDQLRVITWAGKAK